jgi:hypothetical protein
MKYTNDLLQEYIGKWVDIRTDYCHYSNHKVVSIEGNSLVAEYYHWLKTPEDGLLRDHWIKISSIESIQTV